MRRHGGSMGESDPVAIALFSIGEGKAYLTYCLVEIISLMLGENNNEDY